MIHTSTPHLDIIPAHIDLVGAEIEMINMPNREYMLAKTLESIQKDYEFHHHRLFSFIGACYR